MPYRFEHGGAREQDGVVLQQRHMAATAAAAAAAAAASSADPSAAAAAAAVAAASMVSLRSPATDVQRLFDEQVEELRASRRRSLQLSPLALARVHALGRASASAPTTPAGSVSRFPSSPSADDAQELALQRQVRSLSPSAQQKWHDGAWHI